MRIPAAIPSEWREMYINLVILAKSIDQTNAPNFVLYICNNCKRLIWILNVVNTKPSSLTNSKISLDFPTYF